MEEIAVLQKNDMPVSDRDMYICRVGLCVHRTGLCVDMRFN